MSFKDTQFAEQIKKKGYWNYSDLYTFLFNWLKDESYTIKEKKYVEKLSDFGKEIQIEWEAVKKVSDYFRNTIKIKWHILGMKDAEIERDGKKEKTNKGEVKLDIQAVLERDWQDKWEDRPFWQFLRGIYDRYILFTTIDEYEDRIIDTAVDLVADAKAFLELQ